MKKRLATLTIVALAAVPATASAAEFEGTVVSVDRAAKTFKLRDEGRTVTIRVTRSTRFERLRGLSSIHAGMKGIEAIVRRVDGRWVASFVERSGGGGGDDDRAGDDRRGRGG